LGGELIRGPSRRCATGNEDHPNRALAPEGLSEHIEEAEDETCQEHKGDRVRYHFAKAHNCSVTECPPSQGEEEWRALTAAEEGRTIRQPDSNASVRPSLPLPALFDLLCDFGRITFRTVVPPWNECHQAPFAKQ